MLENFNLKKCNTQQCQCFIFLVSVIGDIVLKILEVNSEFFWRKFNLTLHLVEIDSTPDSLNDAGPTGFTTLRKVGHFYRPLYVCRLLGLQKLG
jgi:hypothetical protein